MPAAKDIPLVEETTALGHYKDMPPFIYRCLPTGQRVLGFVAEDVSEDLHTYQPIGLSRMPPNPPRESSDRCSLGRKGQITSGKKEPRPWSRG
jgi:hypothetical protein